MLNERERRDVAVPIHLRITVFTPSQITLRNT